VRWVSHSEAGGRVQEGQLRPPEAGPATKAQPPNQCRPHFSPVFRPDIWFTVGNAPSEPTCECACPPSPTDTAQAQDEPVVSHIEALCASLTAVDHAGTTPLIALVLRVTGWF